jgi:hypothetical protein
MRLVVGKHIVNDGMCHGKLTFKGTESWSVT